LCGLGKKTLAYYDLREEKWTEYLEFEGDEDEEEILAYYDLHEEKWTQYLEFEGDEDEEEILAY
jgi:predicted RNA-binding protein with PUA domain